MDDLRFRAVRLTPWSLLIATVPAYLLWAGTALASGPQTLQTASHQTWYADPEDPPGTSFWFNESTELWTVVAVIAGAITLASAVGTFWIRWSATTDPKELVKADPWLQANLEQYQAEQRAASAAARIQNPGTPSHT